MNWTDGYVAEMEYTHGFYHELAPTQLTMALTVKGVKPPSTQEKFTYFELGCGQGYSLNLLSACHPEGRFFGTDFNPTHIAGAQALADEAGLTNVTFLENSFHELLDVDLPRFDFITLHGIYSWISAENRKAIVDFIKAKLNPGGVVYISYNCLPGWSGAAPLRKLMTEYAECAGGTLHERIEKAIAFASRLKDFNIGYFATNPQIPSRLAQIQKASRNYLAHEYFNRDWVTFYHSDVVEELADAKVTFAAPANSSELLDFLTLRNDVLPLIAETADPVLRETIRDFLTNQQFRRDIFVRGRIALKQGEMRELIAAERFVLMIPREDAALKATFPIGEISMVSTVYGPILDELERGPISMGELWAALGPKGIGEDQVQQAVLVLAAAGYVLPAASAASQRRRESVAKFNDAVLKRAFQGDELQYLASPAACTGIHLNVVERLFIAAGKDGNDPVSHAWESLRGRNQILIKEGKPLETAEANIQELTEQYAHFQSKRVPVLRRHGIID